MTDERSYWDRDTVCAILTIRLATLDRLIDAKHLTVDETTRMIALDQISSLVSQSVLAGGPLVLGRMFLRERVIKELALFEDEVLDLIRTGELWEFVTPDGQMVYLPGQVDSLHLRAQEIRRAANLAQKPFFGPQIVTPKPTEFAKEEPDTAKAAPVLRVLPKDPQRRGIPSGDSSRRHSSGASTAS